MSTRHVLNACLLLRRASPKCPSPSQRLIARASSTSARQWSTPLAKTLAEAITTTGPISIAQYMRQCLVSDLGGYYTSRPADGQDQFGKRGDFITSPEISQVFGELVGIWFVAEWLAQGRQSKGIQLVELGPGRGTLMEDVLRTIANFKPMAASIDSIVLLEASPGLREAQKLRLCGDAPLEELPLGFRSKSKHLPGVNVVWFEDLKLIPQDTIKTPFVVAHEFFDALPIHAFQSVAVQKEPKEAKDAISTTPSQLNPANQWRELLVSPAAPPSVIDPPKNPGPEFELTVSRTPTYHSRLLPTMYKRYEALLPIPGATFETSPESRTTIATLAKLVGADGAPTPGQTERRPPSGAALVIDYGPSSTVPVSSLRGIRRHERCSPFSSPGLVDISADVDFGSLVESALEASDAVEVHGPVDQADWLNAMGGRERSEALVRKARDDETRRRLESGWSRVTERGPNGMGRLYKVMSIVPANDGKRRPVGFGGDVDA